MQRFRAERTQSAEPESLDGADEVSRARRAPGAGGARPLERSENGRYWSRTSDFHRVKPVSPPVISKGSADSWVTGGTYTEVNQTAGPRARLIADLSAAMVRAAEAGDLAAARVAHEALGRLLEHVDGDAAEVVELRPWRERRGKD